MLNNNWGFLVLEDSHAYRHVISHRKNASEWARGQGCTETPETDTGGKATVDQDGGVKRHELTKPPKASILVQGHSGTYKLAKLADKNCSLAFCQFLM